MLTREQAQQFCEKALKFSSFPDCTASISEKEAAFIRFANNGMTTAGFTLERSVASLPCATGRPVYHVQRI